MRVPREKRVYGRCGTDAPVLFAPYNTARYRHAQALKKSKQANRVTRVEAPDPRCWMDPRRNCCTHAAGLRRSKSSKTGGQKP